MDLEQQAIDRIRFAADTAMEAYGTVPQVAYSGGKDSDTLLELVRRSGIPFTVKHNHTTADAPPTIYHVRDVFRELENQGIPCEYQYPVYKKQRTSMWKLIPAKGIPPTRLQRYCCSCLKMSGPRENMVFTGVRLDESRRRKKNRGLFETWNSSKDKKIILQEDNEEIRETFSEAAQAAKTIVNPIGDWTNEQLFGYIHSEGIPMNPLYEMGCDRVGCVGCPQGGKKRWHEFRMFPTYERAYRRAFAEMLEVRKIRRPNAPTNWKTADDVFNWWMEIPQIEGQIGLEEVQQKQEAGNNHITEPLAAEEQTTDFCG